jgi:putative spermidine/putrescine transport system ATP-binding protein/spermidine/putrescine transport system ATP-binding protein
MKDGLKQQEGVPEEVYSYPANHFVADFLGHSNFFNGNITGWHGIRVTVALDDGGEVLVEQPGDWTLGDRVEIVARAQKFDLQADSQFDNSRDINHFAGRIKDRSYMGGEVRYFVELETGSVIHVISGIKSSLFNVGDQVGVNLEPKDCHLLDGQNDRD